MINKYKDFISEGRISDIDDKLFDTYKEYATKLTYQKLMEYMKELFKNKGYEYLGAGRTRAGFLSNNKKYVVKVPKDVNGDCDNLMEYNSYNKMSYDDKKLFGKCRLITLRQSGINILVMEYLKPLTSDEVSVFMADAKYGWIGFIDCTQVGFDSDGNIKAYDYA